MWREEAGRRPLEGLEHLVSEVTFGLKANTACHGVEWRSLSSQPSGVPGATGPCRSNCCLGNRGKESDLCLEIKLGNFVIGRSRKKGQ